MEHPDGTCGFAVWDLTVQSAKCEHGAYFEESAAIAGTPLPGRDDPSAEHVPYPIPYMHGASVLFEGESAR